MFRSISWLLIVSLLTLSMAWAVDDCAFGDPAGPEHAAAQSLDPARGNDTGSLSGCDQWCPGWMSFAALPGSAVLAPNPVSSVECGFAAHLYYFLPAPPPIHPPIG